MKKQKAKHRYAKSKNEGEQQTPSKFASRHYVRRFETAERICEAIAFVLTLLVTAMAALGAHRLAIAWTTGIAVCLAILAFLFWYTDRVLSQKPAQATNNSETVKDENRTSTSAARTKAEALRVSTKAQLTLDPSVARLFHN